MRDLLTDRETAKILGKRINSLYKIVDTFDADQNDEWELTEGEHFEFSGPAIAGLAGKRQRRFSEEGIEAIARYIEATEKSNILTWFRDRLLKVKQKRKQLLVSRRITQEFMEMSGEFLLQGDLAFINRKATIGILQTNYKGLNNSWERLRLAGTEEGEEALELGKDFVNSEERTLLISQRGIARVARDMHKNSKISKARQAWIEAVGDVAEDCFKAEIKYLTRGVDEAIQRAKRAAGHRCEVTGKKSHRQNRIELAGHHIYDRKSRSDLADLSDNILVVLPDLHKEFHSWHKGHCTPNDFLHFLETARADLFDPVNSRDMKRIQMLTQRLRRLEQERGSGHLRYHKI